MASAYYYFVYRPAHAVPVEVGYVLPPSVQVVDTPAEVRIVVGSLRSGERVEITKRTRNWAQIRTSDNLTGWVENKDLLDSQTYEGGQKLLRDERNLPAQAEGHTSGVVNLRLEPSRDSAQLAQLPENLHVQVFGRRMMDRPAPEGQPSAAKVRDAWYLIRAEDRAGWVLGRFVALDIPEKLAPYAQGTNLVAWVVLNTVADEGQPVPEYLTADRMGTQEADFSHIRVFTWWVKNHKYVTAYVESDLDGYFPIRVAVVNGVHYFRLRLVGDQGQKYQKVYGLFDTITRAVGTVPGWESDAMPASPVPHHHQHSRRRRS
ncbi:MAG TPA: SH3 domain-containing protein [Terriglobia bacterium]|nr:SH3 domain-containing protein [Terriglobia bacterium]